MKINHLRGLFLVFMFLSCSWMTAQDLWDGTTATGFHAGNGSAANPYLIRTGAQFMYFISEINAGNDFGGKTIKIMNDIDMNSNLNYNTFKTTSPFAGTLDGGGNIITLQFKNMGNNSLFKTVSGRIHHLGIKASIANEYNGVNYGQISVIQTLSQGGILEDCYYKINGGASLFNHMETLVRFNYGTIQNCIAEGNYNIYSEYQVQQSNLGSQLVYTNYETGIVENCYAYVNNGQSAYYHVAIPLIKIDNGSSLHNSTNINELNAWVDEHPSHSRWTSTGTYKLADFNPGDKCTIEFVDPLFNQSVPSIQVNTGTAIGNLPTPSADCTFLGWKRLGKYVSATDVVSSDWILTAQWEQRIRKQPTATNMSVEVDDVAHASFRWYRSASTFTDLGQWQSTNHSSGSTSSKAINFNASVGDRISFSYDVSSEEGYDYFYAYLNGVQVLSASGEKASNFSQAITQEGENVLLLKYVKDEDTNEGDDLVNVTGIKVTESDAALSYTSSSIPQNALTAGYYYYCKISYSNTGLSLTSNRVQINQTSNITFADANVKALCVANWDTDGDGELSKTEAAAVTSIGTVFKRNTNITSFNELQYFTGLTSIWETAFTGCTNLKYITIPSNVKTIGVSAFDTCTSLNNLIIPNSVTTISSSAFWSCTSLSSITIPSSVTSIGGGAFYYCSGLTKIAVQEGNSIYDSRNDCNAIIETASNTLIEGCKNTKIPDTVTSISGAFVGRSGITSVIIPNNVTSIGLNTFIDCTELTSVVIPNSVTSIRQWAFSGCSGLTSVVSEIKVPFTFGPDAFWGISATCTLTVPYGTKDAYIAKGWTENIFKGGIIETTPPSPNITFADAKVKALCVANWDTDGDGELSEAEAAAVTSLGTVFKFNAQITSFDELQYFTGITSIGKQEFIYCEKLTSVTIPNSVKSIGNGAFNFCYGLTSVNIPNSVTDIGGDAFGYCKNLTSITIPQSVSNIGEAAFYGCGKMTTMNVDERNTKYDSRNHCNAIIETSTNTLISGFSTTIIPNSVTSIANFAFAYLNNSSMTSIVIPNSVKKIGKSSFRSCSNLTSVEIPNSVESIGDYAFEGCKVLTSVISEVKEPFSIDNTTFNSISSSCTLTIPFGTTDAYIAAGWTENVFKGGIVEMPDTRTAQSLSLTSLPSLTYGDAAYTLPEKTKEELTLTWASDNTNVATISGNTLTVTGPGTATITASQVGNEEYKPFSKEFALTVAKAPLTITANDATKNVGEENPAFTASYEGFVKDDDATALTAQPTFTCEATADSPAGTYDINVSGAEAANYEITYVKGTLNVVEKTPQTISLTSLPGMTYGEDTYTLPAQTEEGFDLTWTSSNTSVATISGNTLTVNGAGTTTITASQVGNEEYKPFSKEFTLTVAKAPLTITANDATKNVGDANPAFTVSYEGFVKDDVATALTVQPTFTTEADADSPVGTYDIVVSGAEAANYDITFVNGTLTVVDENALNNTLAIAHAEACKGSSVLLPVSMNNTESIKGIQLDLHLPAGVSVATDADDAMMFMLTSRAHSSHAVSARLLANGDYRVVVSSMSARTFSGTEGDIMNITLNVAENVVAGEYEVKVHSIVLNTAENVVTKPADATATLTVSDAAPGDVNGDGEVNVTDVGMVIDHILENTPANFVKAAADVNGDGEVNVTDVGLVIDIILSDDEPAGARKLEEEVDVDTLDPQ